MDQRRLLVTGVLTRESIAFEVARTVQEQGADIILTGFGRGKALTDRVAKKLPRPPDVLEMDINQTDQIAAVAKEIEQRWGAVDGVLHAIAFAPPDALGGNFMSTPWTSVQVALQTSAYSLKALAEGLLPVMKEKGGSIVSLDFDASVAWPVYDWMGVSKAALEAVTRYLARDLGRHQIRVNCVSAGPVRTMAAKGIPGFDRLEEGWGKRAPLGWDTSDPAPVAKAVTFLLSEWSEGITGEIVHVDGGYHAMGADLDPPGAQPS
ncbi:MAG: meromycolic acid enoyl-[acyl-carrier-protein] reductase [Actinomycetota bacterium]|jgi:enoyl-[acyl-carrier protein] reductase I|nr:meromycolic acid enoyl-[acyl-carrier-protein] reductase [Actinomycetota bacterium]